MNKSSKNLQLHVFRAITSNLGVIFMFIGRERELAELKGLLELKLAHMVVIKGGHTD